MITGKLKVFQVVDNMCPFLAAIGPNAVQLGYLLTGGLFFPFLSGAWLLRRRRLYPEPGPWLECGIAPLSGTTTIGNFPGFAHEASMGFQYAAAVANGVGYRSAWSEPIRVDFDDGGDLITPFLPAWPTDLWAEPIADGEFRVHWRYSTFGQGAAPTDFEVYVGVNPDSILYDFPLGTTTYTPMVEHYTFDTSMGQADGTKVCFSVRARNVTPVAEKNELTTEIVTGKKTAPTAATILSMAQVRQ